MSPRFLKLMLRNLVRSRTRLIATTLGCTIAAFIIVFFLASQNSIARMLTAAKENSNLVVTQKDRWCPTASEIPNSDAELIRTLPQVAEVMPALLKMTSCQSATDVVAVHGIEKDQFLNFHQYNIISGSLEAFRANKSAALLGDKIAQKYGWKTGDSVTVTELGGISFEVAGIFDTNGTADDFVILMGIKFVQEVEDIQGIANRLYVRLHPGSDANAAIAAIQGLPTAVNVTVQAEEAFVAASLSQLKDVVNMSSAVIVVIILVILVAVGNAISMATRDRTREFGIMRTFGYQRAQIMSIVLSEGALQALAGALLGTLAVQLVLAADIIKTVSAGGITISLSAGPSVWAAGIAAVFVAGVLGSLIPAWNVSRIAVVEAIRREE